VLRVIVQTDTPGAQVALQYFAPLMPVESGSFPACFYSDASPQRRAGTGATRQLSHVRLHPNDVRICFKAVQSWSFLMMGIDAMSLAAPEGDVELAALAVARGVPPGKFTTADTDPMTIGPCVVGTGSAVDDSEPVAAYLHRLLGLFQECRVFEVKHA
jgi:hypothetical protein